MTPERFKQIVDAYGADPNNWPQDEREAAKASAAADPDRCRGIIASAPPGHRRLTFGRRLVWPGLGLAGVGLAGALTGALMVAVLLPRLSPTFGDVGASVIRNCVPCGALRWKHAVSSRTLRPARTRQPWVGRPPAS